MAIRPAWERRETAESKAHYSRRAGVKGTHSQGIRRRGLRRARYVRLVKMHIQYVITAVTFDVVRLGEWQLGMPQAQNSLFTHCAFLIAVA
jgi:transposase